MKKYTVTVTEETTKRYYDMEYTYIKEVEKITVDTLEEAERKAYDAWRYYMNYGKVEIRTTEED